MIMIRYFSKIKNYLRDILLYGMIWYELINSNSNIRWDMENKKDSIIIIIIIIIIYRVIVIVLYCIVL